MLVEVKSINPCGPFPTDKSVHVSITKQRNGEVISSCERVLLLGDIVRLTVTTLVEYQE
jgi:hypothetical protein